MNKLALLFPLLLIPCATAQKSGVREVLPRNWDTSFGARGTSDPVFATAVFDDGAGEKLYAAGAFDIAGSESTNLARWTGTRWEAVGAPTSAFIRELCVYDDGSGPRLFASGLEVGEVLAWDGDVWEHIDVTLNFGFARTNVLFSDGQSLYLGGVFDRVDGVTARNVARFDANGWSAMGTAPAWVNSMAVSSAQGSPRLYAGLIVSALSTHLHWWDGTDWIGVPGAPREIMDMVEYQAASGPELVLAPEVGQLTSLVSSGFIPFNTGAPSDVKSLYTRVVDGVPLLWAGGRFTSAGGQVVNNVTYWDRSAWRAVGTNAIGVDEAVEDIVSADLGAGEEVFLFGGFTHTGGFGQTDGVRAEHAVRWAPNRFLPMGDGQGVSGSALAFAEFDDGSGPQFYAGGSLVSAGGVFVESLARWDGQRWSELPGNPEVGSVFALRVWDDGSGPALYVGGLLDGGEGILRWDGSAFSSLGAGVEGSVQSIVVHDDGTGPALWVAGDFDRAGGSNVRDVARWDGTSWSGVGNVGDPFGRVRALASWNDGSGEHLYIGGLFNEVDGVPAANLARWDGSSWSALGAGASDEVHDLLAVDLALVGGERLVVGGSFTQAWAVATEGGVAAWDGDSWSALDGPDQATTSSLAVWDEGSGLRLYAAGRLPSPSTSSRLSVYGPNGWRVVSDFSDSGGFTSVSELHPSLSRTPAHSGLWVGGRFEALGGGAVSMNVARRLDGPTPVAGSVPTAQASSTLELTAELDAGSGEVVLHVAGENASGRGWLLIGDALQAGPRGFQRVAGALQLRAFGLQGGTWHLRGRLPNEHGELFVQAVLLSDDRSLVSSRPLAITARD